MSDQARQFERRLRAVHQDMHDLRLEFTLAPHAPTVESGLWLMSILMETLEIAKDLLAAKDEAQP
jgi:hypothetical protein